VTQPTSNSTTTVRFIVNQGDTTQVVAQHLQDDGLIRSALAFRLYARFEHLDQGIEPGVYLLSPKMTMKNIIAALQVGKPDEQLAGVPDGLRLTQYPPYFTNLPNFSATDFASIVKTGVLKDGTPLWKTYWFIQPPPSPKAKVQVYYALEGYLYPDHYYFNNDDDTTAVVEKMLLEFGSQFCPGPAGSPNQYVDTLADCKAHPAMIGKTSIFTSMESAYHTKNDTLAIYDTLIIASLTVREVASASQAPGVAGVLWTRYAALETFIPNTGAVSNLGSDPSAQYALDSENPPKDNKWWKPLPGAGQDVAKNDPYNNYSNLSILPPGPIANPSNPMILAAAAPAQSKYFYFLADHCGNIHYAQTNDEFNVIVQEYINQNKCSTSTN
jgi:UPF0755 protein